MVRSRESFACAGGAAAIGEPEGTGGAAAIGGTPGAGGAAGNGGIAGAGAPRAGIAGNVIGDATTFHPAAVEPELTGASDVP